MLTLLMLLSFEQTVQYLKNDKIVAIPTETVYGLAGVATSSLAIKKIYQAKNRPNDNPLICHFADLAQIKQYVENIPKAALEILNQFPNGGPFSLLLKLPVNSPLKTATCGLETVICRIPDHQLARKIIKAVGQPIAAPSANTSGKLSPTSAEMVEKDLGEKIDGIINGGNCKIGLESTILDLNTDGEIKILRPGGLTMNAIKNIFGEDYEIKVINKETSTPGAKYRHYSPNSRIEIINHNSEATLSNSIIIELEPETADKLFFKSFFDADRENPDLIYFVDNKNFSAAIKNRLEKMVA